MQLQTYIILKESIETQLKSIFSDDVDSPTINEVKDSVGNHGIQIAPFEPEDLWKFCLNAIEIDLANYIPLDILDLINALQITSEEEAEKNILSGSSDSETSNGLRLIQLPDSGYILDFAVQYENQISTDILNIEKFYVAFNITPNSVSIVLCSGKFSFDSTPLELYFKLQFPSLLLSAELSFNHPLSSGNGDRNQEIGEKYLSSLKKSEDEALIVESVRFRGALRLNNYSFHIGVSNILNIHDKLIVKTFGADVNYIGMSDNSDYSILAYTDLEIGFEEHPLVISLSAKMEKEGDTTRWKFSGSQVHPITVDQILQDFANLFKEGGTPADNPYHLPEFIANTKLNYLGMAFEVVSGSTSEQDYTFSFGLGLPVGEREAKIEMYAHYQKTNSAYKLELTGAIFLDGFQLAVGFAKKEDEQKSDTLILGNLQTPLKLDSQYFIRALSPKFADIVPIDVQLEIPDLLISMHQEKEGNVEADKEYLFRLSFNLLFDMSGFPLIGSMLKQIKFKDGLVLAANKDWSQESFTGLNSLITNIKPNPPELLNPPKQSNATVGISQGVSLSGTFYITDEIGFPLFLNFQKEETPSDTQNTETGNNPNVGGGAEPPVQTTSDSESKSSSESKPDPRSQSKVNKVFSAVKLKKISLIFQNGRLGLKLTGGLSLAVFEFELMGLQITVPQSVLNDPSDITDIAFDLDGFGAKIQKGPLSIIGAFLRKHYEDETGGYDEYNGIIQVGLKKLNLVGMGSYAKYDGHPSLFLFVALGYPIPVHPALLIEGLALGFGIHRDAVIPKLDEVLTYPLIQMSVTPPPPMDIETMVQSMHKYFPPTTDQYFIVAGIKFKAFALVDTTAMLIVKFGRATEIDVIGVSSAIFPTAFIELVWTGRFIPDEGYLLIKGELTDRSYLYIPEVHLTGGFAVAAWMKGVHEGDFVVSVGGYHSQFKVPAHYPNHISRLGISFKLDPITVKGGVYFAITPKFLMFGGFLEASLKESILSAYIKIQMDALISFEPFHYDVTMNVDAGVKVDIPMLFFTLHINAHFHFDMHIWGPDFSGTASIDVGPKTFDVGFGADSEVNAIPISWDRFKEKFLKNGKSAVTVSVTKGLLQKRKDGTKETYVVDPKFVEIEVKSLIPITENSKSDSLGIAPMDIRNETEENSFSAKLKIGNIDKFTSTDVSDRLPKGIWGIQGLQKSNISNENEMLITTRTGTLLTPPPDKETGESHEIEKDKLTYNTDEFELIDSISVAKMTGKAKVDNFIKPAKSFSWFTGLAQEDLSLIEEKHLLHHHLMECEFA